MNAKCFVIVSSVLLSLVCNSVKTQEVISSVSSKKQNNKVKNFVSDATLLTIPFFDDFSYKSTFPSDSLWQDNFAYINDDYAFRPVSYGVATLDALDEYGNIYPNLHVGVKGIADFLTSQPLRLDSVFGSENRPLHAYDSVYFSFFFQPNRWDNVFGLGNGLEGDSLVLEFYAPNDKTWYHIWSTPRFPFDSIKPDENKGGYFIEVIIPIVDEKKYFHKDFMFRFKNYVTLTEDNYHPGWQVNTSQWNIDYVYLNKDRRFNDSYKDICFVKNASSFLKNYYSMPYNQYSFNPYDEMKDMDSAIISNLDNTSHNVEYKYIVTNKNGANLKTYNGGSGVIQPFITSGYYNNPSVYPPVFPFSFPIGANDSAEFTVTHVLTSDLGFKQNDTVSFFQQFYNYYAYDNGSPEYSYSLSSPSYAQFAVRFRLSTPDTLRAVKIFFNDIAGSASELSYKLCVWNRSETFPSSIVRNQDFTIHKNSSQLNDFITVMLDKPLAVNQTNFPNLVFYVGLEKSSNEEMALGFDISKDNSPNTYYNVSGKWQQSTAKGAVMIRPVTGKPFKLAGVNNYEQQPRISVFPNPTNNVINVKSNNSICKIQLFNTLGVKFLEKSFANNPDSVSVSVDFLKKGVYILVITDQNNKIYNKKVIIN